MQRGSFQSTLANSTHTQVLSPAYMCIPFQLNKYFLLVKKKSWQCTARVKNTACLSGSIDAEEEKKGSVAQQSGKTKKRLKRD